MSGQILEAELRIVGSDKTGPAFAGVLKHAQELKSQIAGLNNMRIGGADFQAAAKSAQLAAAGVRNLRVAEQEVARSVALGNAAMETRVGLIGRMQQRMQGLAQMGGMGWMIGGIASGRLARSVARDTGEFEHQRAMLAVTSGMSPAEVDRAERAAMAARVPTMSAADNLKAIGELRMVFGSTEHALQNFTAVQRAAAMMKAVNPQMEGADGEAYQMARALEIKGVSQDPTHFNRLANMMVQAVNASRGKVTGSEFFAFTQYARGAALRLSDDFYTRVAPTLIQEMTGHSAGRAISALSQQLVGGKMTNKAAEEWVKLGLINKGAVISTKTGAVKGVRPGGLVDSAMLQEDPYAWIQKYLKPALAKKGITDPNKVGEELAHLFSNQYATQIAQILLTQAQRIEKDWKLIGDAPGTDAVYKMRTHDTTTAFADLNAGIRTMLGALGSPLAGEAIWAMNKLADGARGMASASAALKRSMPVTSAFLTAGGGAGLAAVSVMGLRAGFGMLTGSTALKGSALALNSSAAALDAAAARLGGGSALKDVAKAVVGGTVIGGAIVGGAVVATLATGGAAQTEVMNNYPTYFDTDNPYATDMAHPYRYRTQIGAEHLTGINRLPITLEDIRALREGGVEPAKAELSGNANISVKVTAGDGFRAEIESVVNDVLKYLHINGVAPTGTTGSVGSSMPEVNPAGRHW
jgi:hypothetical protein